MPESRRCSSSHLTATAPDAILKIYPGGTHSLGDTSKEQSGRRPAGVHQELNHATPPLALILCDPAGTPRVSKEAAINGVAAHGHGGDARRA
ncbi:MAG TPA: hypothetical protein VIT21_01915 [Chthoniobacterales bacterium]